MANDKFGDLYKYYQEFMDKWFGGEDLLSDYDKEYYAKQKGLTEERRKRMQERVMERLGAQGILKSGVASAELTELVEKPIAESEAALDYERMERERKERTRRSGVALSSAFGKYSEEQEKSKGFLERVGGMVGGALSGAAMGIPGGPWGIAAGAALGAGGAAFSPGGGGDRETPMGYNEMFQYFLEMINRGMSEEEIMAALPRMGW
jgi:hypothetical protein